MESREKGKPNIFLREQRLLRGWSLQRVVDELHALCAEEQRVPGVTVDMVSKWEHGKKRPSPFYQEKLCRLYGLSASQLGFVSDQDIPGALAPPTTIISVPREHGTIGEVLDNQPLPEYHALTAQELELRDMNKSRRQMLQEMLSIACSALVLPPQQLLNSDSWERLSMAITRSSSLDDTALHDLETITKCYWHLRSNAASYDLLSGILGHFRTIIQIMCKSQPDAIHEHLCSIVSETAQIIGQMLFDIHDYATAWSYYKFSINAAQDARNHDLEAVGLGRMSFLLTYSSQAQRTLPLLQEAQRLTQQSTTSTIHFWLAAIEAEVHANLQDAHACFRALDVAELITTQTESMEDPYATGFNQSRLAGYKGICFVHLHRAEAALLVLNEALRLADPQAIRRQSTLFTDIARAHVQKGEIEEACRFANQALAITSQTNSISVLQRIRNLRHELEPWKNTQSVKDLDEQFAMAMMSTR